LLENIGIEKTNGTEMQLTRLLSLGVYLVIVTCLPSIALAIDPAGISTNDQDYIDFASSDDHFQAVGLISVPGSSCSGAWLGDEYVLTARHCGGDDDNITFTFPNGQSFGSVGHWASNVGGTANDLAIVRLAQTPDVPATYLPGTVRDNYSGINGQTGTLIGYGGIGRSGGHNTITAAGTHEPNTVQARREDAPTFELGANLIPGDSGGPLLFEESDDRFSIVGVSAVIVYFGSFSLDIWANPTQYSEQIEFGMEYNHWSFFQDGTTPPLPGDLTLDGEVDLADVDAFVDGWRSEHEVVDLAAWQAGDLNGDGITDLGDWGVFGNLYPEMGTAIAVALGWNAVPEPNSCVLVLSAIASALALRRTT